MWMLPPNPGQKASACSGRIEIVVCRSGQMLGRVADGEGGWPKHGARRRNSRDRRQAEAPGGGAPVGFGPFSNLEAGGSKLVDVFYHALKGPAIIYQTSEISHEVSIDRMHPP